MHWPNELTLYLRALMSALDVWKFTVILWERRRRCFKTVDSFYACTEQPCEDHVRQFLQEKFRWKMARTNDRPRDRREERGLKGQLKDRGTRQLVLQDRHCCRLRSQDGLLRPPGWLLGSRYATCRWTTIELGQFWIRCQVFMAVKLSGLSEHGWRAKETTSLVS